MIDWLNIIEFFSYILFRRKRLISEFLYTIFFSWLIGFCLFSCMFYCDLRLCILLFKKFLSLNAAFFTRFGMKCCWNFSLMFVGVENGFIFYFWLDRIDLFWLKRLLNFQENFFQVFLEFSLRFFEEIPFSNLKPRRSSK